MALLSAFHFARVCALWPKESNSFLELKRVSKERHIFSATIKASIFPDVYRFHSPKFPLAFRHSLSYVGKSSQRLTTLLSCPGYNTPYAQFDVQHVVVDPTTHKSAPFPDWWMKKYGTVEAEPMHPLIINYTKRPTTCPSHNITVKSGDCDENKHTNNISYGIFCYDTCCALVNRSKYKNVNSQMLDHGLKQFNISYKRETFEHETLTVYSWEDDASLNTAHFEIQNQFNDICCQASFEFYSDKPEMFKNGVLAAKL